MPASHFDPTHRLAQTRKLAAEAWAAMIRHGVSPTPHAYEVWFTHCGGDRQELSARIDRLLGAGEPLTEDAIEALYEEWIVNSQVDVETMANQADPLYEAAQGIFEHVAGSQAATERYCNLLAHWSQQLKTAKTAGTLAEGAAALTGETVSALARNQELERQLAAAKTRIGKLQQSLSAVKQEATTDVLTGISNRRAFDDRLRKTIGRGRSSSAAPISLMLLDIDHFKKFNDTFGHRTGDLVLRLVGRLLADNIKGRDMAARYGGEEFAILLDGANLHAAYGLASRLCVMLSSKSLTNKRSQQNLGNVTISIGVAQYRPDDTTAELLGRADAALYRAKNLGRDRACVEEDGDIALAAS